MRIHLPLACILFLTSACGGAARFVARDTEGGLIAVDGEGYGERSGYGRALRRLRYRVRPIACTRGRARAQTHRR